MRISKGVVRLGKVPIGMMTKVSLAGEVETARPTKINYRESPIFQSIRNPNGEQIYEDYKGLVERTTGERQPSWSEFLKMRSQIADGDYINSFPPIFVTEDFQIDGHHRLAILLDLRGPRANTVVVDGVVFVPRRGDTKVPRGSHSLLQKALRTYKWHKSVSCRDEDGYFSSLVSMFGPELHGAFEFRTEVSA